MSKDNKRELEYIERLYEAFLHEQRKILTTLDGLKNQIILSVLFQVCRDNERNLGVLERLSNVLELHIGNVNRTLRGIIDSYAKELEQIDNELNENLTGVFSAILEFLDRVRKIKGIEQMTSKQEDRAKGELGLSRIDSLLNEVRDLLKKTIKTKRDIIMNIYNEISNIVYNIISEKDTIRNSLSIYSILNERREPIVIGVPVVKIALNSTDSYVALTKGFETYSDRILNSVVQHGSSAHGFRLDYDLLDKVIKVIKSRNGALYRLFIDTSIKTG